ncbi:MAG TPA: PAS domain-containing sensor histidine kinase [Candidatus Acidoferrales bacterium]|nr:PAS domain-containing sensor histidine kinase [Candidatus Acidoferrales bacterium]
MRKKYSTISETTQPQIPKHLLDHARSDAPQTHERVETHSAQHRSLEPFRLFVEAVTDYAIFMLDEQGRIISWNAGAERVKGYRADEIIGKHFSCFYTEEDLRAGKPQRALEIAAREGRLESEGWRLRKDGTRFWANVVITALKDERGEVYGYGKVTRDMTERKSAEEALRQANEDLKKECAERSRVAQQFRDSEQSLHELSGQLLRLQDEERRRIGRDLHDSTGQTLAALSMNLAALEQEAQEFSPQFARALAENADIARKGAEDLRTLSFLLHPPLLDELGLRSALRTYIDGFATRSNIRVQLDMPDQLDRMPTDLETAIFRIVQECLTNIHRHAQAPVATIRLARSTGGLMLSVEDTGKGIPPEQLVKLNSIGLHGVGLRGMRERIKHFGGELDIKSDRTGTRINVAIPLPVAETLMKS